MASRTSTRRRRGSARKPSGSRRSTETGRYTPPALSARRPTPRWVIALDIGLFVVGLLLLLLDFIPVLPGAFNYYYLLGGFGALAVGFLVLANVR